MQRKMMDRQQWQNTMNNAQGHYFEEAIITACMTYQLQGKAEIDKTPEPFRVMSKECNGIFTGRFIAAAQPDFKGTLKGGRSIVFEAKYTSTERLNRNILTDEQMRSLDHHYRLGALAGVCAGIRDRYYFIPWLYWRDMKIIYGRQYLTAVDLEQFRVRCSGPVMFLDYIHENVEGGQAFEA